MTKILVDQPLRTKLQNFTQPLEFYDEAGRILGRFFPAIDPSDYEDPEPPIPEEELQQRMLEKGGKTSTTDQVIEYLEKL